MRRRALFILLCALFAVGGCGPYQRSAKTSHLAAAREEAQGSNDAELVGAWLLAELVASKGSMKRAAEARKRLASLGGRGMWASLARAIDADAHGRFVAASAGYVAALRAARDRAGDDTAMMAWFAANRLVSLSTAVPDIFATSRELVEELMARPGAIGWRARGELVEWWSQQTLRDTQAAKGDALFDEVARQHGCLSKALIAGPFGHGVLSDHRVSFEAEKPAPWPARFTTDERRGITPKIYPAEPRACVLHAPTGRAGVYYVQSFIDLPAERDVIVAVQGAYALFVDDTLVLDRNVGKWGVWPRFGVRLRLGAGRHRILARLIRAESAIRVLAANGRPLGLTGSAADEGPYALVAPRLLADPNVLDPFLRDLGVTPLAGAPKPESAGVDRKDPVLRYVAAYLAHVEGQDDVASVLLEPLMKQQEDATPVVLAQQAVFVDADPIYAGGVARDLARDLRQQASERDDALWGPRLWLALQLGDKGKPAELVEEIEALSKAFPEVPAILEQLAAIYSQLGWPAEHQRALELAAKRFPNDVAVLESLMEVRESRGDRQGAEAVAVQIIRVDPGAEVLLKRALLRADYPAAVAELRRIGKVRADRRDIAYRVADLLERAGEAVDPGESLEKLKLALAQNPADADARLALADAKYAAGDSTALTAALVEAIESGADDARLRRAIELAEGMTNLAPYRRDGLAVIASVKESGVVLPGIAARVLDYGALWVAPDGTARMLEHEIIRVQSREGIQKHVEQQIPQGVILRMRTIKADGRVFEPELVSGKPTVTMPHLEVGDYIETESIWLLQGASEGGKRFRAPRWYFREESTSYHISDFVVITPAGAPELVVETTGTVPAPTVSRPAGLTVRTWSVRGSLALPQEPLSAPIDEFLPSVRVGWGIDLAWQLARIADLAADEVSRDPRMVRIAERIVTQKKKMKLASISHDERARRIYRWVLDNIQPGKEQEGPRIITGQSGDRTQAFIYLCRLVGVDARLGLVRDRLSPEPNGPFSEAEYFNVPAVRIKTAKGSRWLLVHERFAPYGYLPSSLRGQPAVVIQHEAPVTTVKRPPLEKETTSAHGSELGVSHKGTITLRADGSAQIQLTQEYHDRWAFQLRKWLNGVSENRRKEELEARLLGLALPGARVEKLDLPNLDDIDEPVRLSMTIEAPNLARLAEGELVLDVPFMGSVGRLVRLPIRESPLYIDERFATRTRIDFTIVLPDGATVASALAAKSIDDPQIVAKVRYQQKKRVLAVEREVSLPAGRILPKDYAAFRAKVLEADDALTSPIRLRLK